jgi:predicted ATP-grasp superfamily ATP-dependent carboligase
MLLRTRTNGASSDVSAIVLGSSARPSLVCVRSLGGAGRPVLVVDLGDERSGPAAVSRWTGGYARIPAYAGNERASARALALLVERHRPAVVVPTSDGTVDLLRRERALLDGRTGLALADEDALAVALDKERTLAVAAALGIPVPDGLTVRDVHEAEEAARRTGYPAVVKPARSWEDDSWHRGRRLSQLVVDRSELRAAVQAALEAGSVPLVQPWLCGAREAVSLFVTRDGTWARFAQVAHRMQPPLGGTSVVRESVPLEPTLLSYAERLLQAIGFEGYAEVEFRRDAHGVPRLMEVNPRLSASVGVAVAAGVDFPAYLHAWRAGLPLPADEGYRAGVRMRWLGGDLRWLGEVWRHPGRPDSPRPAAATATFLKELFVPSHYDYVDRHDLRPAGRAVRGLAGAAGRKAIGRAG